MPNAPESWPTLLRSLVVGGVLMASCPSAPAEVTGSFILNGDGTITYFYEVSNLTGTFDISLWSLEFDFPTPDWDTLDTFSGGDVSVPNSLWFADAGIPVSGASAQDFLSLDPAGDVLAGTVLAGFSFTSSLPPGPVTYREFSATGDSASGTTVGPTSVIPEASTWISAVALGTLAGSLVLRRRHPASILS
jgi:hypothetical protein